MTHAEAALEAQLETARDVLREVFSEVLEPTQREKLRAVLRRNALGAYDHVVQEPLTDFERMLVTRSIEELVTIRGMLPVEANPSAGQAAD